MFKELVEFVMRYPQEVTAGVTVDLMRWVSEVLGFAGEGVCW